MLRSTLILSQFFNENDGQVVIGGGSLTAGEITLNGGVMTYESGTVNAPYVKAEIARGVTNVLIFLACTTQEDCSRLAARQTP